jgi:replicative DNA helicase
MQLEITLLRMLTSRETWDRVRSAIPRSGLEEQTKSIAKRVGEYYRAFPDVTALDADSFLTWYFGTVQTKADAEVKATWRTILNRMMEEVDAGVAEGMYAKLLELDAAAKAGDVLTKYAEGDDIDVMLELGGIMDAHKHARRRHLEVPVISSNVLDLLDNVGNNIGVKWRLQAINDHMRPMDVGDFIGVAARPDRGKTSFLTDQASFFAPQLPVLYGEKRPLLWFCNEGSPRKIWLRMYSSVLNMSVTELGEFRRNVCKGNDTKFLDAVYEKIGGDENFKIINANKMENIEVEDIVAQYTPSVVIYDMIDNFKFAGLTTNGGSRTDQVLESMYQWARELCVETNHIGIATSQISGEGEGLAFPSMSMLKDSKTGKQGTFDTLIMIGASNANGLERHRFLSTPKNKLTKDGAPSNMKIESIFDGSRGRFNGGQVSNRRFDEQEVPKEVEDFKPKAKDEKPDTTKQVGTKGTKHEPLDI